MTSLAAVAVVFASACVAFGVYLGLHRKYDVGLLFWTLGTAWCLIAIVLLAEAIGAF